MGHSGSSSLQNIVIGLESFCALLFSFSSSLSWPSYLSTTFNDVRYHNINNIFNFLLADLRLLSESEALILGKIRSPALLSGL